MGERLGTDDLQGLYFEAVSNKISLKESYLQLLDYMEKGDYEQVAYCCDNGVGLKAIIAIHDTTLGPALGGARVWNYSSEEEALTDVLRLARAMTYKAALAGLDLGGGKTVVIGIPPESKREALFRSLGGYIESLSGRYITTEDVGTTMRDMEYISNRTRHVTGLPFHLGGSGDPSPTTARGVVAAMKACAKKAFGSTELRNRKIVVQGLGKVGSNLIRLLAREGAQVTGGDINPALVKRAVSEFKINAAEPGAIHSLDCDIFSPCALGGILNDKTIPELKCKVVCGGANNQLLEDRHGDELSRRGILYAPDYLANAGGIINLSLELTGYDAEASASRTDDIFNTMEKVIVYAAGKGVSTSRAADLLVEERIANARKIRKI